MTKDERLKIVDGATRSQTHASIDGAYHLFSPATISALLSRLHRKTACVSATKLGGPTSSQIDVVSSFLAIFSLGVLAQLP